MGDAEFKRVFEASPATRRSEWASVALHSFLIFLVLAVAFFVYIYVVREADLWRQPVWWLAIFAPAFVGGSLFGYFRCRLQCRFSIIAAEDYLQINGLRLACDDVIEILTPGEFPTEIRLRSLYRRIRFHVDKKDRDACAVMIYECCTNAVFMDSLGREHLPHSPTRPQQALNTAKSFYTRMGWTFVLLTIVFVIMAAMAAASWLASPKLWHFGVRLLILMLIGIPSTSLSARRYFKLRGRLK